MNKHALRILIIEDEESVRKVFRNTLCPRAEQTGDMDALEARLFSNATTTSEKRAQFELVEATQAQEGVEHVEKALQEGRPFCIAFIDVRLPPGPHGVWAAESIRKIDPNIQIVIVTAYSDFDIDNIMNSVPPADKLLFILKPFHPVEIRQFAAALSSKWVAENELKTIQMGLEHTVESQKSDLLILNEQLREDIARRIKVEEELDRHAHVFQTMDEAVILTNGEGIIQDCNPAFTELFGLTHSEAQGQSVDRLLVHSDTPASLRQKAHEHGTWRGELGFYNRLGHNGYALGAIKQLEHTAGFIYIILDISDRKQVLSAFIQSREMLQYVFDHIDEGVVILDEYLVHISVNLSYCRILEEDRKALIGKSLLPFLEPAEQQAVIQQVDLRRQNKHSTYEMKIKTSKGHARYLRVSAYPRFDENNVFTGSFGVVTDITEQTNLRDQLLQTQKMETLGAMAGGVVHDFNNLLSIIGGATELLKVITTEQKQQRFVNEIEKAVGTAKGIVSQLLIFSRKQEVQFDNVQLNEIISETLIMLKRIIGSRINIKTQLEPTIPTIMGNAEMIRQILLNLIINARDAMPDGGEIHLHTQATDSMSSTCKAPENYSGSCIRLTIRDTGVGMDESTRAHAFEPFFTTKGEGKGTGLGLSTVYELVKRHKGWVTVDSMPGKGTEFNLFFPVLTSLVEVPVSTS